MKGKYDEHYKNLNPQPIEVIENWGLDFHLANVLKYISRAGKKEGESELKDLEKAKVYLERKIEKLIDVEGGLTAKQFEDVLGINEFNNNTYKVGQVWTCANNPKYTLTIKSIHDDGVMLVIINDGDSFERFRYFRKCGKVEGYDDPLCDGIFDDLQLTVLKRDVYAIEPKEE